MELDTRDSCFEDAPLNLDAFFSEPIRLLEAQRDESCDGAFLALSASLAMYERFLIKLAQSSGRNTEGDKMALGGEDLGCMGEDNFRIFWGCFRDGLQHQFQPTKKRGGISYDWRISDTTGEIPKVTEVGAKKFVVEVNPWAFARLVRRRFDENPTFFQKAKSHMPGTIRSAYMNMYGEPQQSPPTPYQEQGLVTGHFLLSPESTRRE